MTTERTHGRLATSIRLRNELVPPSRPPAAQLQPVLLSWWSGKVGRFLRKRNLGSDYVQSSRFAPGLRLAGSMMLTCSGSPELPPVELTNEPDHQGFNPGSSTGTHESYLAHDLLCAKGYLGRYFIACRTHVSRKSSSRYSLKRLCTVQWAHLSLRLITIKLKIATCCFHNVPGPP